MTFPYKVTVKSKGDGIDVKVRPQPVATKDVYLKVVTGSFQNALLNSNIQNTLLGRARLKSELTDLLRSFHEQGMIRPMATEEGIIDER